MLEEKPKVLHITAHTVIFSSIVFGVFFFTNYLPFVVFWYIKVTLSSIEFLKVVLV